MARLDLGAKHTRWGGQDAFPSASDATKAKYASAHLRADWRNAVWVDGHVVETVGWAGEEYDDRVRVTAPDGSVTHHESARSALRAAGL